jgi:hypothetical protein
VLKDRLRLSENEVQRRVFGPKKDEMTGDLRRLHTDELHNEMGEACSTYAGIGNVFNIMSGRMEGRGLFGISRHSCEDNIKTDLRVIGMEGRDWINLADDRGQLRALFNSVMKLGGP